MSSSRPIHQRPTSPRHPFLQRPFLQRPRCLQVNLQHLRTTCFRPLLRRHPLRPIQLNHPLHLPRCRSIQLSRYCHLHRGRHCLRFRWLPPLHRSRPRRFRPIPRCPRFQQCLPQSRLHRSFRPSPTHPPTHPSRPSLTRQRSQTCRLRPPCRCQNPSPSCSSKPQRTRRTRRCKGA